MPILNTPARIAYERAKANGTIYRFSVQYTGSKYILISPLAPEPSVSGVYELYNIEYASIKLSPEISLFLQPENLGQSPRMYINFLYQGYNGLELTEIESSITRRLDILSGEWSKPRVPIHGTVLYALADGIEKDLPVDTTLEFELYGE